MSDESALFLDDGYTATKTIEAVPGLHPELRISYRPALHRERLAYRSKLGAGDAAAVEAFEIDLIVRHRAALNGVELRDKEKLARLRAPIRAHLLDLILSYEAADEAADAKN